MKLTDIIELAKMGYTAKDVKDLIAMPDISVEDVTAEDTASVEGKQKTEDITLQKVDPELVVPDTDTTDVKTEDIDYRSLYEAEVEKNSKLKKLALSADMSGQDHRESDSDTFASIMRDFM